MRLGTALRLAILPALGVGPILGLLGSALVVIVSAIATGGGAGLGGVSVFAAMIGLVAGLLIASPVALVFGTLMIMLGSRDRRWLHPLAVAAVGLVPGAAIGALLALGDELASGAVVGSGAAALGAVGALLFRKLVVGRIDDPLEAVDPDIFA